MAMTASSAAQEPTVSRFGLTQVYIPPGTPQVDVVFVHGLNGDPHNTWTSEKAKTFWPAQLLPPIVEEEKARILVYGYDADVTSFTDGVSRDKIHNHAEHLVAELAANRRIRKATERPIIFVAHSLGGLVVKRALIYSSEIRGNYTEHLRSVFVSTYGILFLGVPHKGSDVAAWGSRLEWICNVMLPKKVVDSSPQLIDALKTNNETLQNIDRQFIQLSSRFHIYFFHEGKPTNLKGTLHYIVDEESASPNIQDVERAVIQADHSHMAKFESDSSPGFDLVADGIQRYAGDAPPTISVRWGAERSGRDAEKRAEVKELFPGSTIGTPHSDSTSTNLTPDTSQTLPPKASPDPPKPESRDDATNTLPISSTKPTDPYFIVPPGFRANTYFVAMEKEYNELDRRLFHKRRRDGTACVLLHGQPGVGKSHLARQYVYKNRKKFAGGIFWITAKSKEEMYHSFWNIKQKVVSRDAPELCDGVQTSDFVHMVKMWFQSRSDWLIVFDGVNIEKDEDATELVKFIPDSQNSSLIYVSRAKNLESKQELLRPFPIKVNPLKEEEASKLLFKMLHIKKATEAEKKKATELVKQIGGLPLAIDMISHRLADTHEPLVKFKLSYSANPTLESTYDQILDDLLRLDHTEAWNLINVMCWFGQNIPVEMVHLGLRILKAEKVEVRSREDGGEPDINNTFSILMRYALIERNEPETDKDSMSSSRDSLVEPEPIDMLKIHSVVQNFCCVSLSNRNMLPLWLGYAVKLFSYSYHEADIKIKQKSERGRVSDYRYYLVHGQTLWDHSVEFSSKTQTLDDIRGVLHPIIDKINKEIRLREPGSSQESLKDGIFQVSIFDRTTSSSDSGPSIHGPPTPDHRPTPPPLDHETIHGFPKGKELDSPTSFGTASPGIRPNIVDEDVGYDSDREGQLGSQPMRQNLSEITARPSSRPRTPNTESHEGWQVVPPPSRRPKRPRRGRDLGSFRPAPTRPARVRLDRSSATGSVSQSHEPDKEQKRDSSPAFESLQRVQSESPPPSRRGLPAFFGPSSRRSSVATQPTWAGIAAGRSGQPATLPQPRLPNSSTAGHVSSYEVPVTPERGRLLDGLASRHGNVQQSTSPLASEFAPLLKPDGTVADIYNRPNPQHVDPWAEDRPTYPNPSIQYTTAYRGSSSALSQYQHSRRPSASPATFYTPPPVLGPKPAPLTLESNISFTTKHPAPASSTQRTPPSYPPSRISPQQPLYPYPPPPTIPSGYTSQPMSRDHSHASHISTAETEPLTYPPTFSPHLPPTFPASDPLRPAHFPSLLGGSPRERAPDGRPLRKSPKMDHALPATAGGYNPYSLSHQQTGAHSANMSRNSSGPGIVLPGQGLGIVAFAEAGQVQFGELTPVGIEEARRRRWGYEERLRGLGYVASEEEGGGGADGGRVEGGMRVGDGRPRAASADAAGGGEWRGGGTPYPDVNLMPSGSDGNVLEGLVGGRD